MHVSWDEETNDINKKVIFWLILDHNVPLSLPA